MKVWDHILQMWGVGGDLVVGFGGGGGGVDVAAGSVQSRRKASQAPLVSSFSNVRKLSFATAHPTGCAV